MNVCSITPALWATLSIGTLQISRAEGHYHLHSYSTPLVSRLGAQSSSSSALAKKIHHRDGLRNTHTHIRLAHIPTQKAKTRHLAYLHIPFTHTHTAPLLLRVTQEYSTLIQFNTTSPSPSRSEYANTNKQIHIHQTGTCNSFHSLTSKHTHTQRFLFSLRHHINTYTRRTFSFPSFTFLHFILTHPSYQFACPLYHIHQMQILSDSIRFGR